jgi:L-serine dehydratase
MINFENIADLVALASKLGKSLGDVVLRWETERSDSAATYVHEEMRKRLTIMRAAAAQGLEQKEKSLSGLVGGDAYRLAQCRFFVGPTVGKAAAYAMAISEVNACMGKIVAGPTAGSCGVLPGAVLAVAELLSCDDDVVVGGLFTAAGVGEVVARNATVSGAVGGCQAECGTAAAMAAAAVTEMMGGKPQEAGEAVALALKNMLGLVCDPVAGLVEVPCVKRNAFAAVHALVAAQMALAGIKSVIPADEVIEAMYRIGLEIPCALRETSEGGLAKTSTAMKIAERLLKLN